MYEGKLVFAQIMEHLPLHTLRSSIARYDGDRFAKGFGCQDQFRCMAFAQLTYRDSLRDTVTCLNAQAGKLYHMGIRGRVRRSTLARANEVRDWRIYASFATALIAQARELYADDPLLPEFDGTAYALDTSTIDLALTLFPWAPFERSRGALKLHTQIDLRGNIPVFIHIDHGRSYDTDILDVLVPEPGAIYVMDRGYLDFERLHRLTQLVLKPKVLHLRLPHRQVLLHDQRDREQIVARLHHVVVRPLADRQRRRVQVALARHDDDRQVRPELLDPRNEIEGALVRHQHVGDDEVAVALTDPPPQCRRVARRARRVARARQRLVQNRADSSVVVGDQNVAFGHLLKHVLIVLFRCRPSA